MLRRVYLLVLSSLSLFLVWQACSKGNACRTERDCPTRWTCELGSCFAPTFWEHGSSREGHLEMSQDVTWQEKSREEGVDGGDSVVSEEPTESSMSSDVHCVACSWLFTVLDSPQASGNVGLVRSVLSKAGELYLTLQFRGQIEVGGNRYTAKGTRDTLFVLLNDKGELQWVQQWGGRNATLEVTSLQLDASGTSLFLGGTFEGSLLLGSNILSSVDGSTDSFLSRFDLKSKNFSWVHPFGSAAIDALRTFVVDGKDNIHALVYSRGLIKMGKPGPNDPTKTFDDNIVMQFDSKGALLRTFAPQGPDFRAYSLACDAKGNLILAGYVKGSLTFDSTHNVTTGSKVPNVSHLFLGELDANYKVKWLKSYPTSEAASNIIAERLLLTKTKIAVVGSWGGASLFVGTPQELKTGKDSSSDLDLFVAEFDRQGKVLQTARWGDALADYGFALLSDPAGGYYVGGSYGLDAFFSKSKNFPGAKPAFGIDPFVLSLDGKLQPKWLLSIPGGSSQQTTRGDLDAVHQLHLDQQGCLTVVGFFRSDATLGCFGQKKMNFAGGVGVIVWRIGALPP